MYGKIPKMPAKKMPKPLPKRGQRAATNMKNRLK